MKRIKESDLIKVIVKGFSKNDNDVKEFFDYLFDNLNLLIKNEKFEIVNIDTFDRDENRWNIIIEYNDEHEDMYNILMDDFFKSINNI